MFLQAILLVDWAHSWFEACDPSAGGIKLWLNYSSALGLFAASIVIIIFQGLWFVGDRLESCAKNFGVLVETGVICLLLTMLSAYHKIERGSLLVASVVSLYSITLVGSAIIGNAQGSNCTAPHSIQRSDLYIELMGVIFSAIVVSYNSLRYVVSHRSVLQAAYQASSGEEILSDLPPELATSQDYLQYNLSFFHFVYTFAACYLSMLFTDWDITLDHEKTDSDILVFWLKVIVQILCAVLYMWSLVAPLILKRGRDSYLEEDPEDYED